LPFIEEKEKGEGEEREGRERKKRRKRDFGNFIMTFFLLFSLNSHFIPSSLFFFYVTLFVARLQDFGEISTRNQTTK
jgi:hypothetical protein